MVRRHRRQRMLSTPFGRVRDHVMCSKAPTCALEQVLQIYDPGLPSSSQTEEVLGKVVHAYGLQNVTFPSRQALKWMVIERVDRDVGKPLARLGYRQFSYFAANGRSYMEVSTDKEGEEPPALPSWLKIPSIIPTRGHVLKIIPDNSNSTNRRILSGQTLKDTKGEELGSLGAILVSTAWKLDARARSTDGWARGS